LPFLQLNLENTMNTRETDNVKTKRYMIQNGRPSINGSDCPQFQKSRDNKNNTKNIIYHKTLLFFGNHNIRFFKVFTPFKPTFSWFFRLETVKTMPL